MILIALTCITSLVLIKYKPMYEVKISGTQVGYVNSKEELNETIKNDVEGYQSETIEKIELTEEPEYELKLVDKEQTENESEIIIALQKTAHVTYKEQEEEIEEPEEPELANINGIKIAILPVEGTISSRYGAISRVRSSAHKGLDIATASGTPIKAVADGTIIAAAYDNTGYGNLVKIDHGNGIQTWYGHTSKMYVEVGQEVKAGDIIAAVGSTGNSTGPHLHFEIRINGEHVNPQNYLYN